MTPRQRTFWLSIGFGLLFIGEFLWLNLAWPQELATQCSPPMGETNPSSLIFHIVLIINLVIATVAALSSEDETDMLCLYNVGLFQSVILSIFAAGCFMINVGCYGTLLPQTSLQWPPLIIIVAVTVAMMIRVAKNFRAAYPLPQSDLPL